MPLNNIESSKLTQAYDRMLERVKKSLRQTEPKLHEAMTLLEKRPLS